MAKQDTIAYLAQPRARTDRLSNEDIGHLIRETAAPKLDLPVENARALINLVKRAFLRSCEAEGLSTKPGAPCAQIAQKLFDAGRRSPPTTSFSKTVPGRPQSGADGNRIKRWLLDSDHKFYADEITATLVEVKYFLHVLGMAGAPKIAVPIEVDLFTPWLIKHEIRSGAYIDPIQLIDFNFQNFLDDRRIIESGHFIPLDRGGRHEPTNTFLMLASSNRLQGNLTLHELLDLLRAIITRHDENPDAPHLAD